MAQIELIMPKMGESITEATILKWLKKVGDVVQMDEIVLEIATDKVDSDVPAPVSGVLAQIFYGEESVVDVGKVIAIIATEGEKVVAASPTVIEDTPVEIPPEAIEITHRIEEVRQEAKAEIHAETTDEQRFYSTLVKNIAKEEKISEAELDTIPGTGANGRLTKQDLLTYVEQKQSFTLPDVTKSEIINAGKIAASSQATSLSGNIDIIEMDRMRKLIAEHMIMSKQTSAHVTSFVEADVTNMVLWRDKNKNAFKAKYGENITFTPLFIDAVVRAIKDYPMINISLEGNKILIKKDINIGMAAALPTGNLIVPVVKNADMLSMAGLARAVNDLAGRARENKLKPDEIKDGTFTLTNVGTFGNLMGTPIINQPQVAILATGAIVKKPAVLETEFGDVIAIRHLMFLSLSYDHRIVDGALGGAFLKRISDNMEKFDPNTSV